MRLSAPSSENRFLPIYLRWRNVSSVSASVSRARMRSFCSRDSVGEAEMLDLQLRRRRLEEPERVQIGEEVAADAVRVDQLGDLLLEDLGVKAILHLGNRNDVEAEVRRSRKGKIPVPVSVSRRR